MHRCSLIAVAKACHVNRGLDAAGLYLGLDTWRLGGLKDWRLGLKGWPGAMLGLKGGLGKDRGDAGL